MAVHTYIGARYVPRFMGTYDPTQIYDALDVVDNGSGTSYIARKTVPAGTPLTDTSCWFVYGASSGAIVQLQNDMITAQNDIYNLQLDVTQLQGSVAGLDSRVDYLSGDVRRVVTLSDSYGNYPTPTTSWQQILESIIGGDFYNFCQGSIGICHQSYGVNCLTLLQNNSANIPDHGTITDIVIGMGGNDVQEAISDVNDAYNNLIAYIRSEYPKARIHFGFPTFQNTWGWLSGDMNKYIDLVQLMQDKCGQYNLHYCSGIEYVMHNIKNVQSDGVHPTSSGAAEIARGFSVCLKGGVFNYKASLKTKLLLDGDTGTGVDVIMSMDGPISNISLVFGNTVTTNPHTFPRGTAVKIGDLSDTLFRNGRQGAMGQMYSSDSDNPSFMQFSTNSTNFYGMWYGSGSITLDDLALSQCAMVFNTLYM